MDGFTGSPSFDDWPAPDLWAFSEKIVHRGHSKKRDDWDEVKGERLNDDELDISSTFGSVIRYITSEDFRYAEIDASFAGVKVYLDQARIPSGNATINIDSSLPVSNFSCQRNGRS